MPRKLAVLCALLFSCATAHATTWSAWEPYSDNRGTTIVPCRWKCYADCYYPGYGWVYHPTSGNKAQVPHQSYHGFRLEALSNYGLGTAYMTLIGSLQRWDAGGGFWRYFDDTIISGYFPPNEGPMYYETGRKNPYAFYGPWYDWVYVTSYTDYVDAFTQVTNHELGYATIEVGERTPYYVRY